MTIVYIIILSFLCICIGIYIGSMQWLKIKHVTAELPDLPSKLCGFRILHITDLHGNNSDKMNLDIWAAISRQEFDIAVITGDMVVRSYDQLSPHMPGLKALAESYPVYFVEGNHDYYPDSTIYTKLVQDFDEIGIHVLANNKETITYNGTSLEIIGFRDYYYLRMRQFKPIQDLMQNNSGLFKIILSHQPQMYDRTGKLNNFLMIVGHTHGGQVRLPFFPTLYAPGQGIFPKYGNGWYEKQENNSKMYISRGIGTTVFPIRFFNRPEITVIELKSKD